MLRPYNRGLVPSSIPFVFRILIFKFRFSSFLAALWTDIGVFAERNLERFENVFFVEAEALAVGDVADVGAELAIGPEEITDRSEQLLDVIVLLDELRDVARGTRGGNVFERLRGLGVEANSGNVLR